MFLLNHPHSQEKLIFHTQANNHYGQTLCVCLPPPPAWSRNPSFSSLDPHHLVYSLSSSRCSINIECVFTVEYPNTVKWNTFLEFFSTGGNLSEFCCLEAHIDEVCVKFSEIFHFEDLPSEIILPYSAVTVCPGNNKLTIISEMLFLPVPN